MKKIVASLIAAIVIFTSCSVLGEAYDNLLENIFFLDKVYSLYHIDPNILKQHLFNFDSKEINEIIKEIESNKSDDIFNLHNYLIDMYNSYKIDDILHNNEEKCIHINNIKKKKFVIYEIGKDIPEGYYLYSTNTKYYNYDFISVFTIKNINDTEVIKFINKKFDGFLDYVDSFLKINKLNIKKKCDVCAIGKHINPKCEEDEIPIEEKKFFDAFGDLSELTSINKSFIHLKEGDYAFLHGNFYLIPMELLKK